MRAEDSPIPHRRFEGSALNHRQLEAINRIPIEGFWTVPTYKEAFSVSTMTAFRDLKNLVQLKLLTRRGHSRLTTYHPVVA